MIEYTYAHNFLIKLFSVGSIVGGFLSIILQEISSHTLSFWQTVVSVIGAGVMTVAALLIKDRLDKKRADRENAVKLLHDGSLVMIDKEKVVDQRVVSLIDEMSKFYAAQHATDASTIAVLRQVIEEKDTLAAQQRDLIAAQAVQIQSFQVQLAGAGK